MKQLVTLLVWMTCACGNPDRVYITEIVPFDLTEEQRNNEPTRAGDAFLVEADEVSPTYEVDTTAAACLRAVDGACRPEPYTSHFALVTVNNDHPKDPNSPDFGRRVINQFTIELTPTGGGNTLPTFSGGLRVALLPETSTSFGVILFSPTTKAAAGGVNPRPFNAQFRFEGQDDLQLTGSVTMVVGDFNNCDSEEVVVPNCNNFIN